jgi:disulfide bond formation protein DsbB
MRRPGTRGASLVSALAAGLALAVALVSEHWGGLVPCALCLLERWPYRIAIVLSLLAFLLPRALARLALWLVVLTMLAGAALGAVHVGVEQGLWPSPLPECAAPHIAGGTASQLLASMPAHPTKPCDAPSYLVPGLPLSMAAMNLIYAAVFAVTLASVLLRPARRRR